MHTQQSISNNQKNETSKVRLTVDVSPELNETLNQLAKEAKVTKSDVLRRAITLMEIAIKAKEKGQKIALIDENQYAKTEIVGV